MGIFFRKSKKTGPFRLNFSTSGIGISTGVKGARISVGPSGTFVHLGRNGIYYRKKLNSSKKSKSSNQKYEEINLNNVFSFDQDEEIITTTNFDNITDSDSTEFVRELERKDNQIFLYKWLGILPCIFCVIFLIYYNNSDEIPVETQHNEEEVFIIKSEGANLRKEPTTSGSIIKVVRKNDSFPIIYNTGKWLKIKVADDTLAFVHNSVGNEIKMIVDITQPTVESAKISPYLLLLFIPLTISLFIFDQKRKRIEIYYSVEEEFGQLYDLQKKFFAEFHSNIKIWQKTTSKGVSNSKYHGGASNLVDRIPIKKIESDSLPSPLIRTNVEIPHISLSNIDLYFFPERLILKRGKKFAAVFYKNMEIKGTRIRFIEDGSVPKDALVIGRTWKYVNKSGGPDRRFNNNRQLPICQYSEYHISGQNGINEIIMTSKPDGMINFANYINKVGDYQYKLLELRTAANKDVYKQ